jgi:nucleotide-binding universal stress UspA family protein
MSDDDEHFQRVLVPVDFEPASDEAIEAGTAITAGSQHVEFSDASLRAVKMAAALCKASQGKLYMVHVTPPMQYTTMYTGPVSLPAGVIDEIHDKARSTSMAALKYLTVTYCQGIQVEHCVGPGQASLAVLEEAARIKADLVVMASSGRSRVARFFVGSTADRVIREANCPVLVIPAAPHV